MLDSGSVVNVNDIKIRKEGSRIDDFYLNQRYLDEAFKFWKVQELPIEDVFKEQDDPWIYDWERKFILITIRDIDITDVLVKCIKEPCVLIMHVPDLYNDAMRMIGTMEVDWIELPDNEDLFINNAGTLKRDDGVSRWLIWIDEKEFDIIADNWGGNVESWVSYASKVDHRGRLGEEDIFARSDEDADEHSSG